MTRKRDANRGGQIDYTKFRPDSGVEHLRIPPQSIEAEMAVIGGLMLAPDAWPKIADKLSEADFYRRDHQLIYRAIAEMAEADPPKPYDAVTLGEWFESQGLSEQVAGGAYLVELASTTPSAANITAYAEIVRDKAILRQLIEAGTQTVNDAFQPEGRGTGELIDAAQIRFNAVSQHSVSGGLRMVSSFGQKLWERTVADSQCTAPREVFTPWPEVNDLFRKRLGGKMIVLGARPSVGKTALALQIALWQAEQYGKAVAFFSLEMTAEELTERLACILMGIASEKLDNPGDLTSEEWALLSEGIRRIRNMRIAIDDSSGLTVREMRARAIRMHKKVKGGLGLIVMDYLQLAETSGFESREQGIAAVSRGVKNLAKELDVPFMVLSQLNRGLEKDGREPTLADLRESGAIEQDADVVMFLHPAKSWMSIIVGKNRAGKRGRARLSPELQFYRFKSYDPLDEPPEDDKPATRKRRGYGADTASARAGDDK